MIEKITNQNQIARHKLAEKINELIDAVNELQAQVAILEEHAHPTATTKPAENAQDRMIGCTTLEIPESYKTDPYTEKRKWIGKLCRFWNFKDGAVDIGILKAVDNLKPSIPYISDIDCSYAFCEPVKPDDDIIYKGGDNE